MTDNEIVKALEICTHEHLGCEDGCPFIEKCGEDLRALEKAMIGLIKNQKAEIENLNIELQAMRGAANSYKAEVERLQKAIKVQDIVIGNQSLKIQGAKKEAIKEFAERLKERTATFYSAVGIREEADNLVKEMVGEKDV